VGNFSGVVDETGRSSVTVTVGADGNGGNLAFDPAVVRVSAGTEVTWEWNGMGGSHNVVAEDGSFESELTTEEGHTFSHTFEESGVYTYSCQPHKTLGMKGAVVVE
jgi:halocyanin-like protein